MEEEVKTSVSEQENVGDNSANYIEAIKEMKANTVDKQAYLKLKEENKQLLNSLVNGQGLEQPVKKEEVNVDELRKELFGAQRHDMTNLDYVTKALKLREAIMEKGECDPFVPQGSRIKPTDEDFNKANKVASVLQECVDYAEGNPDVFTDELKRRII